MISVVSWRLAPCSISVHLSRILDSVHLSRILDWSASCKSFGSGASLIIRYLSSHVDYMLSSPLRGICIIVSDDSSAKF